MISETLLSAGGDLDRRIEPAFKNAKPILEAGSRWWVDNLSRRHSDRRVLQERSLGRRHLWRVFLAKGMMRHHTGPGNAEHLGVVGAAFVDFASLSFNDPGDGGASGGE